MNFMETLIIIILAVFIIVGGIGIFRGLDIKKWSSWMFGLYGFLSGILIGIIINNISGGLKLGVLFAFGVMFGGAMTYWQRKMFR